ncbi:cytochrome P450 [Panaeolus papilionaceus]|nr:cytochrome P450 [Panaeolus papilionaceus]
MQQIWTKQYGSTFTYKGFMGRTQLFTIDTKAVQHVLTHYLSYPKPEMVRYRLSMLMGNGLVLVEGDRHREQRRIMNPAFSAARIREMTPIFTQKSLQARDVLLGEIEKGGGKAQMEAMSWLSKVTLDIIGLAGFNYNFNALDAVAEENALIKAFSTALHSGKKGGAIPILRTMFPSLRWLPASIDGELRNARHTMREIGIQVLRESEASLLAEQKNGQGNKDLLSLLIQANKDVHLTPNERLSDEEVMYQIITFLSAGHETSSLALTWVLFALTHSPDVQTKLRDELLTIPTDNPSMDELNSLHYLDCVVREVLRLYSPVISTIREATSDDVIPLANPIRNTKGEIIADSVPVKKGQMIFIGLIPLNKSEEIWGKDAAEFRPERWDNLPEASKQIPGVWGNIISFLGGPRSCIGYRFALVEMKAIIFTLGR